MSKDSAVDHVVVDVEIRKTIAETPGGWNATDKLGVAVACVWEYRNQRMRVYGPDDVNELQARLLTADRISGYNIFNFDFPVIWGLSKAAWQNGDTGGVKGRLEPKTDDMLRRIWTAQGFYPDVYDKRMGGTKLNDVASATIGVSKIGNGEDAPIWYQQGLIQKVANYCADDVAIERDLANFIDQYGYVIIRGGVLNLPKWVATC